MRFLIPQGIGDSVWALTKIQDMSEKHGDGVIDIVTNCSGVNPIENRALEFILGFDFVCSAGMKKVSILLPPWTVPADENGYYRYIDSGPNSVEGVDWTLIPNSPMERGIRLEDWLPEYKTNWDLMNHFHFTQPSMKRSMDIQEVVGDFCVFYLGPLMGNTREGHNRNSIWKPEDWITLGDFIQNSLGLRVIVVGASYDEEYFDRLISGKGSSSKWVNLIGKTNVNELYSLISIAKFVVSYQSGVGIVSEYLRVPTAIFWRQKGDSVASSFYISFDEKMNGAWSPPDVISSGKHLTLYYGRHDAEYVCGEIEKRGWHKNGNR